jgi:hypothetical protein
VLLKSLHALFQLSATVATTPSKTLPHEMKVLQRQLYIQYAPTCSKLAATCVMIFFTSIAAAAALLSEAAGTCCSPNPLLPQTLHP